MAAPQWRPQQCADVQLATLDDETVLYHPARKTALALNATASSIWRLCDGERTLLEIIDLLRQAYPEAADRMPREVEEGVLTLLDRGVVRLPRIGVSTACYEVRLGGTTVKLEADTAASAKILAFFCGNMAVGSSGAASVTFRLGSATRPGWIAVYQDDVMLYRNRSESLAAAIFLERTLEYLVKHCTGMLLHAAAMARNGRALILAGKTGAGKTTLATWLVQRGLDYVTEELVWVGASFSSLQGFARPLHVKKGALDLFDPIIDIDGDAVMKAPSGYHVSPRRLGARVASEAQPAVLIFPTYRAGARFDLRPLSKAQAASHTIGCLVNAHEHLPHGFDEVIHFVQSVPAFAMTYASLDQAGERLEKMLPPID